MQPKWYLSGYSKSLTFCNSLYHHPFIMSCDSQKNSKSFTASSLVRPLWQQSLTCYEVFKSSYCLLLFQHQILKRGINTHHLHFFRSYLQFYPGKAGTKLGFSFLTWFGSLIIEMFLSSFKLHDSRLLLLNRTTSVVGWFPSSLLAPIQLYFSSEPLFNYISPLTSSQAVSLISLLWQASV